MNNGIPYYGKNFYRFIPDRMIWKGNLKGFFLVKSFCSEVVEITQMTISNILSKVENFRLQALLGRIPSKEESMEVYMDLLKMR